MATPKAPRYFQESGRNMEGTTIPTADFDTTVEFGDYSGPWLIEVFRSLANGSVTFTLNYSMDGVNFFPYREDVVDVKLSGAPSVIHVPPIFDDGFKYNHLQLSFTISGTPSGTITARLYKIPGLPVG